MSQRSAAVHANGPAIRAFRQARGLSATTVVDTLLIEHDITFTRAALYNVELGHKNPSPAVANALAAVLRVPPTAIVNATPEPGTRTPARTRR